MPLLRISALHKYYGDHHVLKGIDLTVEEGQVVAIIGRSGSGKSTLLRTLNGLESINDGVIEVDGEYLDAARADLRSLRQKVGMVFQQFNLFPHLTVGENVMLAPQVVQKVPKAKAAQLARQMLERVGLGEKFDAFPDRLSGGQQQRVAIARALAMSPKVLLCDEITSALDPELVNEVLSVVRQLAKDGMTLIMVTHEMRFAREVGDKLVFMHQGKVHEVGPAPGAVRQPAAPPNWPTSSARWGSRADQLEGAPPLQPRFIADLQGIGRQVDIDIDLGRQALADQRLTCCACHQDLPRQQRPADGFTGPVRHPHSTARPSTWACLRLRRIRPGGQTGNLAHPPHR